MARDFDGAGDFIEFPNNADLDGATQVTFSGWVWQDAVTNDDAVFDTGTDGTSHRWGLYFDDVGSVSGRTDTFKMLLGDGVDTLNQEWSTNAGVAGAWQHLVLTMNAGVEVSFWVNGVEDALSPVAIPAIGAISMNGSVIRFGNMFNAGDDRDGRMAELSFWDRILTDSEIVSLSKGFSPLFLPNNLFFYAPLIGRNSPEIDIVGGTAGTLTNTTNVTHPRIIYPSSSQMRGFKYSAGVASVVKDLIGGGFIPFSR